MRWPYIFLLLISLCSYLSLKAQSAGDTIRTDTCKFKTPCPLISYDTAGIWERGSTSKPFFDPDSNSPGALITDTVNPYDTLVQDRFTLKVPLDDHMSYYNFVLEFRHQFETDSLIDGGYIDVSHDGGQTWTPILQDDSALWVSTKGFYSTQDSIKGGNVGFSGTSDGWRYSAIEWTWSLPAIRSIPDTTFLRFSFISDSNQTNKDGWMIDRFIFSSIYRTSLQEHGEDILKEVRPNPMRNRTVISFEQAKGKKARLTLYDTKGRRLRKMDGIRNGKARLKRKGLESGLYFFRIKVGEHEQTGKLLVR